MGNTVANMMFSVQPSTQSIHMTSLPILRTARGPTIQGKETTPPGTLAIQGPISIISESTPGVNFEAWKVYVSDHQYGVSLELQPFYQ